MERYRSGHNEAVLKTVCPQGRVGSNPTLSAEKELDIQVPFLCLDPKKNIVQMQCYKEDLERPAEVMEEK